jgi:plasmid stabilization system protein ParE
VARQLLFSPRAAADLRAILDFIARERPPAARRVVAAIERAVAILADHPESGRQTDASGVRVLTVPRLPFKVFCLSQPDAVTILHVRHTSRRH